MVQTQRDPVGTDDDLHASREMYLILYPKELEEEVIQTLEASGVQEVVIWPFPVQGQEMDDYIRKLAQDVLPHVAERGS